jgi:hypothetical protein
VWERVLGGVGEQRTKAIRCGAFYYSIVLNAHRVTSMADIVVICIGYIFLTYDMYKSSLRHIHDPVLSSLKMKGKRLLFFQALWLFSPSCATTSVHVLKAVVIFQFENTETSFDPPLKLIRTLTRKCK